ncbi:MAG: hypothetical protein ACYCPN_01235 [Thermoplasmata archaeon]
MRKTQRLISKKSTRWWFLGTVIAMVGITIGAAFAASAVIPHTVTQQTSAFQSSFEDVPAFAPSTAALTAAFAPSGVTSCTPQGTSGTPIAIGSTAVTNYYSGVSSSGTCTAGDFSEAFSITAVAGNAGTWNFQFSITAAGATTPYVFSTVYSTSSSTTAITLTVYLDFGGTFIPSSGIQSINLLVTPT